MFPLTFHLLHKCRKMYETAPKFLPKCRSSGSVMLPFPNTDFKKKVNSKTKRSSHRKPAAFCIFAGCQQKKWSSHHARHRASDKNNNNAGIKHCFVLLKMKNAAIKRCFALVKNSGKHFALFCAYREHCW